MSPQDGLEFHESDGLAGGGVMVDQVGWGDVQGMGHVTKIRQGDGGGGFVLVGKEVPCPALWTAKHGVELMGLDAETLRSLLYPSGHGVVAGGGRRPRRSCGARLVEAGPGARCRPRPGRFMRRLGRNLRLKVTLKLQPISAPCEYPASARQEETIQRTPTELRDPEELDDRARCHHDANNGQHEG